MLDRIILQIVNRATRTVVDRGINAGIDHVSKRSKRETTPEQDKQAKDSAKRAKDGLRMVRRFGRF